MYGQQLKALGITSLGITRVVLVLLVAFAYAASIVKLLRPWCQRVLRFLSNRAQTIYLKMLFNGFWVVDRVVASDTRWPEFESKHHQQILQIDFMAVGRWQKTKIVNMKNFTKSLLTNRRGTNCQRVPKRPKNEIWHFLFWKCVSTFYFDLEGPQTWDIQV